MTLHVKMTISDNLRVNWQNAMLQNVRVKRRTQICTARLSQSNVGLDALRYVYLKAQQI